MTRPDWQNLNGEWDYLGGASAPNPAESAVEPPDFPDKPEQVRVPYPPESYLSGVMRKQELNMWYRRNFTIPESWSGDRVLLHFEAVDCTAAVFVNGRLAGTHVGAWDAFTFDITDLIKSGENQLIVGARDDNDGHHSSGKDSVTQGDYTFTSGIWQTVWLERVPGNYIKNLVITPDVKESQVKIDAQISGKAAQVEVTVSSAGQEIAKISRDPGETFEIPITNPHLWSPSDPFLYDLEVRLVDADGKIIDKVGSYFGMRSVSLGKVAGKLRPLLNGKFVAQIGPLDQGYWPDGIHTPPTDAAMKFDLEKIKEAGFNLVRKHTKVEPRRFYYWTDKLGLLVWQDMPSMWYPDEKKEERDQFERGVGAHHPRALQLALHRRLGPVPTKTGEPSTSPASPTGPNNSTPHASSAATADTTTPPATATPRATPATATSTISTSTSAPATRHNRATPEPPPSANTAASASSSKATCGP